MQLPPTRSQPELIIVGMPLDETAPLSAESRKAIERADLVIGESRKVAFKLLAQVPGATKKPVHLLDPPRADTLLLAKEAIEECAKAKQTVILFSDTGMPILFDPGAEILEHCKTLNFRIRSTAGPTSWGMACSLSGYSPPFFLLGFLPREKDSREQAILGAKSIPGHLVLMETPYRFRPLLTQLKTLLGGGREAFLAWEIAKEEEEQLLWGSLANLERVAEARKLEKGEFILVVKAESERRKR